MKYLILITVLLIVFIGCKKPMQQSGTIELIDVKDFESGTVIGDSALYIMSDPSVNINNGYEYFRIPGTSEVFFEYFTEIHCLHLPEIEALNEKYNVELNIKCEKEQN